MDDDSAVTLLVTIIADRVRQHIRLCLSRGCDKTPHSTEAAFMNSLHDKIRTIPDFPKPGVSYRDITPLVADPKALRLCVHHLIHPFVDERLTAVVGMEARGFIFGSLAAWELDVGFVPLRKPGKLPYDVHSVGYELEYGTQRLEVHVDALTPDDRVLVVDDVLATGGTAAASCALIEKLGAEVAACAFVIELDALRGRDRLSRRRVHTLLHYCAVAAARVNGKYRVQSFQGRVRYGRRHPLQTAGSCGEVQTPRPLPQRLPQMGGAERASFRRQAGQARHRLPLRALRRHQDRESLGVCRTWD